MRQIIKKKGKDRLAYFDESGFESVAYQPYCYAKKGQIVYGNKNACSRPRTNLIIARQDGKLIAPVIFEGSADAKFVNEWVEKFLIKELKPNSTVILDNARFHNKVQLTKILKQHGHELLFLPPYSPDFNPVEHDFANIKRFRNNQPLSLKIDKIISKFIYYCK